MCLLLQAEIEKVKRRREERDAERARQEEELSMLQRERAAMEARELEHKEEHFHLEQVSSFADGDAVAHRQAYEPAAAVDALTLRP